MLSTKSSEATSRSNPVYDISDVAQAKYGVTLSDTQAIYLIVFENSDQLKKFYHILKKCQQDKVFNNNSGEGFCNFCVEYNGSEDQYYIMVPKHILGLLFSNSPKYSHYLKTAPAITGNFKKEVEDLIETTGNLPKTRSFKLKLKKLIDSLKAEEERKRKGEATLVKDYPTASFIDVLINQQPPQTIREADLETTALVTKDKVRNLGFDTAVRYDITSLFSFNFKVSIVFLTSHEEAEALTRALRKQIRDASKYSSLFSDEFKKHVAHYVKEISDTEVNCVIFLEDFSKLYTKKHPIFSPETMPLTDTQKKALEKKYESAKENATTGHRALSNIFSSQIDAMRLVIKSNSQILTETFAIVPNTTGPVSQRITSSESKMPSSVSDQVPMQQSGPFNQIRLPQTMENPDPLFRYDPNPAPAPVRSSVPPVGGLTAPNEFPRYVPPYFSSDYSPGYTNSYAPSYPGYYPPVLNNNFFVPQQQTGQAILLRNVTTFKSMTQELAKDIANFKQMNATEKRAFLLRLQSNLTTLIKSASALCGQYNNVYQLNVKLYELSNQTAPVRDLTLQEIGTISREMSDALREIIGDIQQINPLQRPDEQAMFFASLVPRLTSARDKNSAILKSIETQALAHRKPVVNTTSIMTTTTENPSSTSPIMEPPVLSVPETIATVPSELQVASVDNQQSKTTVDLSDPDLLNQSIEADKERSAQTSVKEVKKKRKIEKNTEDEPSKRAATNRYSKEHQEHRVADMEMNIEKTSSNDELESSELRIIEHRLAPIPTLFESSLPNIPDYETSRLNTKPLDEKTLRQADGMLLQTPPVARLAALLHLDQADFQQIKTEQANKFKAAPKNMKKSIEIYLNNKTVFKIPTFDLGYKALTDKDYPRAIKSFYAAYQLALSKQDKETAYVIACYLNHAIEIACNAKRFGSDKERRLAFLEFDKENPNDPGKVRYKPEIPKQSKSDRLSHLFRDSGQAFNSKEQPENRFILQAMVNAKIMVEKLNSEQVGQYVEQMLDAFARKDDIVLKPTV